MTDQLRATPQQWERIKQLAKEGWEIQSAIYELRSRIEALEAAQLEQAESNRFCVDAIVRRVEALESPMAELRAASAEARPGGLVERVGNRLPLLPDGRVDDKAACAVIHEVAAGITPDQTAHGAPLHAI
jgi:hypothetical protein